MTTQREEYLKVVLSNHKIKMYLDLYARTIANQLGMEAEDVRQDLLLHLVKTANHYNPAKATAHTYARVCLKTARHHMNEKRMRLKRAYPKPVLYTESAAPDEGWDTNIAIRDRLKLLPKQDNRYAALLASGYTKGEADKAMGLSRWYGEHVRARLAEALA